MKKLFVIVLILASAAALYSEDLNSSFKMGIQAGSDGYMGFLLKAGSFETGLKAMITLNDPSDENDTLLVGAHLSWLFNSMSGVSSFGTGVDFRNQFGAGYDEHIDLLLRLNYNYHLSDHFMLTGLFYPLSFSTRGIEDPESWSSIAVFLSGAVAVTMFF